MAPLSQDLLSLLRCPVTGSSLVVEGDQLVSTGTGADGERLRYRIEDGIALLLRPEQLGTLRKPTP